MIKKLAILCLMMIVPILSFSQDTLKITSSQLRTANVIFSEHAKFSKQVPLLEKQIVNLNNINNSWIKTDSIRKSQISQYSLTIEDQNKSIEDLKKSINIKKKVITYGAVATVVTVVLCLVLKK